MASRLLFGCSLVELQVCGYLLLQMLLLRRFHATDVASSTSYLVVLALQLHFFSLKMKKIKVKKYLLTDNEKMRNELALKNIFLLFLTPYTLLEDNILSLVCCTPLFVCLRFKMILV